MSFTPHQTNDCSGARGRTVTLRHGLRVTQEDNNPDLEPRCGLNVMLVLDESYSIQSARQVETVREATKAFLTALSGTGSKVSIVEFGTEARRVTNYLTVTQGVLDSTFFPYVDNRLPNPTSNGYNPAQSPTQYTNWEDAFRHVKLANNEGPLADLVVFITDGDPTARGSGNDLKINTGGNTTADMVEYAAVQADAVKGQGSHILALGVGQAPSRTRLQAISGPDELPPASFEQADFTVVRDFDKLAEALAEIAVELCKSSMIVTKWVDHGDGTYVEDDGWRFRVTVSTSPAGFRWVLPTPGTGASRSASTDEDGVAIFQWKPDDPTATSTVTLEEVEIKEGYEFVADLSGCDVTAPARTRASRRLVRRVRFTTTPTITVPDVGPKQIVKCNVYNRIRPGTITIEKEADPEGSQAFTFGGSLGGFELVDDGTGNRSSRTFANLTPGTYTVSETVPAGWEFTGVICTPPGSATISGTSVSITLAAGGSVHCTFSNVEHGRITIAKDADPQGSQVFVFGGTLGPFTLVDDGTATASRTFTGLNPGTYEFTEVLPDTWEFVGAECTPEGPASISELSVSIELVAGASVRCVFRNRIPPDPPDPPEPPEPPTPPEPPEPPPPFPPGPPPEPPTPPAPPPSADLRVVKTAPRVARVGDRVRFRLRITNTGSFAAKNVRMLDVPPAAMALTGLRSGDRARIVRGNAVWRLGTLAPGASRTVSGTVRIQSGTPGLKRNRVLAVAVNAGIATDRADTRLLAPRRPPAVTG